MKSNDEVEMKPKIDVTIWIEKRKKDLLPKSLPKKAARGMRKFSMARVNDQSGVSGPDVVAEGVIYACGKISVKWLTPLPDGDIQIKDSLEKFLGIHVHPHPDNITIITYEDGEYEIYPPQDSTN